MLIIFMSPRIKKMRKVLNPPIVKGFKPYGPGAESVQKEPVNLLFEEYEALRLCDYDLLNHHQASEAMSISRPTFTRIYASARKKIANAFVEGRQIFFEGGKVYFDSDWYRCERCMCYFNNPEKDKEVEECPLCGSKQFNAYDNQGIFEEIEEDTEADVCVCPRCGFEQVHTPGNRCNEEICPRCNSAMRRKCKNH